MQVREAQKLAKSEQHCGKLREGALKALLRLPSAADAAGGSHAAAWALEKLIDELSEVH